MVIPQRSGFYFVLCVVIVLSTFGLSSVLLRRGVVRCLVAAFYPCEDDSDRQDIFDESKISNYGCHYVE